MVTTIKIDLTDKLYDISPLIYGNFIEFITDCINKGMWAELLLDRGFENEDSNGDGVSDPWYPTGFNDAFVYSMDSEERYNSGYSQKIEVINHYGGHRGIAQIGLRLVEQESYKGYIWARARNFKGDLSIVVKSSGNQFYFEKQFKAEEDKWTKYEFEFESNSNDSNAVFEINISGEGEVWFDQVSLMPESSIDGVWKDVVEASRKLNPGIIRFPGGCFADCYDWEDGTGPRDERPTKENLHWKGKEENNFGTDEFIKFCRNINSEPMICVNFGSGTPEQAANWVEYCNGGIDTGFGAMRAANGNPEPYNVKYWDIGNENFGEWEIGHCTAEEFSKRYLDFYAAMKAKDSSIEILACGGNGNDMSQDWNRTLLEVTDGKFDHIALHCYAPQIGNAAVDNEKLYYGTVGAACKYDQVVRDTRQSIAESTSKDKDLKIAITEWNAMFVNDSYREHTLEAAIFNAGMLNMFLRNCDMIRICNYSDLVNGWQGGCIRSDRGKVYLTPSYYALKLYSDSGARYTVNSAYECDTYDIDEVGHIKDIKAVPYIDVVSCMGENELIIFIINRHLEKSTVIDFDVKGGKLGDKFVISEISSNNPYDCNTQEKEKIKIKESVIYKQNYDNGILIHPCSIVRIKIPIVQLKEI